MSTNCTRGRCIAVIVALSVTATSVAVGGPGQHQRLPELTVPGELRLVEDHVFGLEQPDGTFGQLVDAAVNSQGEVYILDSGFFRVYRYSNAGELLTSFGAEGEGPGDFRDPMAIAVGRDNRVYVGGAGSLVSVYDENGTVLTSFKREKDTFGSPVRAIAIDSGGELFISTIDILHQKTIYKFSDRDYSLQGSFGESFAAGHDVDTRAERVFGGGYVSAAPEGLLLYAQLSPPQVYIYRDNGELYTTVPTRASEKEIPDIQVTTVNDMQKVDFSVPWMSDKALSVDGESFIVTIISPGDEGSRPVYVDWVGYDGKIKATTSRESPFRPVCMDKQRRLYVIEIREEGGKEYPVVVRYEIANAREVREAQ